MGVGHPLHLQVGGVLARICAGEQGTLAGGQGVLARKHRWAGDAYEHMWIGGAPVHGDGQAMHAGGCAGGNVCRGAGDLSLRLVWGLLL